MVETKMLKSWLPEAERGRRGEVEGWCILHGDSSSDTLPTRLHYRIEGRHSTPMFHHHLKAPPLNTWDFWGSLQIWAIVIGNYYTQCSVDRQNTPNFHEERSYSSPFRSRTKTHWVVFWTLNNTVWVVEVINTNDNQPVIDIMIIIMSISFLFC